MKIIAIDFDGTIVHSRFPVIGAPMLGAAKVIKELMGMNNVKLILWTVRDGDYLKEAVEWCERNGLKFDAVNENYRKTNTDPGQFSTSPKVYAHYYIDDKGSFAQTWRDGRAIYLDWEKVREDIRDRLDI